VRGEHDLALALRRVERDGKVRDGVEGGGEPVTPAERDQDFARSGFLGAECVPRNAVYIGGCRAHLVEQRGGGIA
jgi:hypothetical protein